MTLYFVVTALTTTHRMLLLEEAQSLPIVNLKIPLLPFYTIAPFFYLVMHFYVLMMLLLLARSADVFEKAMVAALPIQSDQEQFRMRAENVLFLQLLIGAKSEREGFNGRMLSTMGLITLAVAPVLTLVVMQMQFLPYHHQGITWLHRVTVVVDVVLILLLWRGFRHRKGRAWPNGPVNAWQQRKSGWVRRTCLPIIGVRGLFLRVSLWRWQKRQSAATLT